MKEWTEKHQQEALRRTYEIAAELVGAGKVQEATYLVSNAGYYAGAEDSWRGDLADADGPAFDAARIDREVRRVRGLAEGRLVRETVREARDRHGDTRRTYPPGEIRREERALVASQGGGIVRVTRVRRLP